MLPSVKPERRNQRRQTEGRRQATEGQRTVSPAGASKAMLHPKHLALGLVALLVFAFLFYNARNGRQRPSELPPPPGLSVTNSAANTGSSAPTPGPADRGAALLQEGNRLLQDGKAELAVQRYREAGALLTNDEDVHYNLGIALARLGRADEAMQEYEAALKIFPDYAEVHNNLGNLLLRRGKTEEAIAHFEAAIKAVPDYATAHNNLGNARLMSGRFEEAATSFLKAATLNTNYWEPRFNLGNIYARQGRTNEAAAEYREVLRLNPGFKPAADALAGKAPQVHGSTSPPAP